MVLWLYGGAGRAVSTSVTPASWVQMTRSWGALIGPAVPAVVVEWEGGLYMKLLRQTRAPSPPRAGGPVLLECTIGLPDAAGI